MKLRRRSTSTNSGYESQQQKLPFIKPLYVKENMFISSTSKKRSHSTLAYTRNVSRQRHVTQSSDSQNYLNLQLFKQQPSSKQYQVQNFYKTPIKEKMGELQKQRKDSMDQQVKQEQVRNGIYFSFMKRRTKKYKIPIHSRQQVISPMFEQLIRKQKIIYSPSIFHREFVRGNVNSLQGKIRKQVIQNIKLSESKSVVRLNKKQLKKSFRKLGNAILFIQYLKRYSGKFRSRRRRFFQKNGPDNIRNKLVQLKLFFSHKCSPFYEILSHKYEQLYQIVESDSTEAANQKLSIILRLIGVLIDCISKGVDDLKGRNNLIQIVYSICKHGSYGCLWDILTTEELDISCISLETGYISADNHLEQSAIIQLIFVKIIVFNLLLKPESINFPLSPLYQKSKMHCNMKIIGNILYQIFISIQDKQLQLAGDNYTIGNWRNLTYKFDIRVAESMTIKKGLFQKNELISGLFAHSLIRKTYKIDEMSRQLQIVQELIIKTHIYIKELHENIRKSCM